MFRNFSLNTKLTFLTSLSVILGLLVACTAFWVNDVRSIKQAKFEQLCSIGETLAFNCTGVLTFQDDASATELLTALESHESIVKACLRNPDGSVFAWFGPEPDRDIRPPSENARFDITPNREMVVTVPVVDPDFDNEILGSLTLTATTADLDARLWHYLMIVGGTVVLALLVAMLPLMLVQREISRPILALAETAEAMSGNEDFSIRVQRDSADEIGVMYQAFNRLLDQVQHSEAEIRKTQKQLISAREKAEQANSAKSEFLANMSHEIRTPLTGILGFTDLMLNSPGLRADTRREYLRTIQNSGKHLLGLINDILDLSKIEAGQLAVERIECNPHLIISEVVNVMRVKAKEKQIAFDFRWTSHVPKVVECDPVRLRQMVMNLVSNSIKFTNQGGVVVLAKTEPVPDSDRSNLIVEVIDTGIGIPEEKQQLIFEPFAQADNSVTRKFGGTGLGLSIVRQLAAMLGGDLTLFSREAEGSAFKLTVDAGTVDRSQTVRPEFADALLDQTHGEEAPHREIGEVKILIVEDGEVNRNFLTIVLQQAGATVTTAENGQIGFEKALTEDFDVILMDMQMPVMDGYTATERLRAVGFDRPIIALTAHAMVGDRAKCIAAGCTDYLTKPIDINELVGALAKNAKINFGQSKLAGAASS